MERMTLTVAEVAELIGVSKMTIYTMCRTEEIPCKRVRGRILFYRPVIMDWLAN
ncbi:helix-turn-helix domain-containing protein [Viridibacillus arvi]|uniref:helix-turn-helix domain-containing protein n=1 Tax=Viridibacillus arvi TaxID=263475 RepID=UPI003CFFC314